MNDEFNVEGEAPAVAAQILTSLAQARLHTSRTETGIQARAGSDLLFRLLGAPLGASQLPVGLDVRLISAGDVTRVSATAYDRLGWYFNKKLVWGEHVMDRKLTDLLNAVRAAANKPPLPERKASFNP